MRTAFLMFAVPVLLLAAALPVRALDWPVQKRIIIGTFGQDRGNRFLDGLDIGGGEQEVRAVLPGELAFRYDENEDYTSMPRGLGSFIVLQHDGRIETIAGTLKKGSLGPLKTKYAAGDVLGTSGDTGYSDGTHVHFSLYDEETASFLNPLSLLPQVASTQQPVIKRVLVSIGDTTVTLENGAKVPHGRAEVIAEAYDFRQDVKFLWPLGLYGVRMSLDGKEVSRILFDSLQEADGRLSLGSGKLPLGSVYTTEGLLRCGTVELRAGSSHLILSVRDYYGSETTKEFSFTVRE
ncbi:MAG TPA: M23 family metallopeptidase [Spirochaetia bacterium]|nr:M23 family metallopeptidase [Spirochaetia bacterium]